MPNKEETTDLEQEELPNEGELQHKEELQRKEANTEIKKESKRNIKQYKISIKLVSAAIIIIIGAIVCLALNKGKSKNIPPYCTLSLQQQKTCKIHNEKHTKKNLSKLSINPEEMVIQEELVDKIIKGAYFDGKKLYGQDEAKEIIDFKNNFEKEKETLFGAYLSGELTEEEQTRYNFLIEELDTLESVIKKLKIEEVTEGETKEELKSQVEELTAMVDKLNKQIEALEEEQDLKKQEANQSQKEVSSSQEKTEGEYTESSDRTEIKVPSNVTNLGAVKKSDLYN